jgi:hypothetical protein
MKVSRLSYSVLSPPSGRVADLSASVVFNPVIGLAGSELSFIVQTPVIQVTHNSEQ